jgi:fluoroquinolone transport system permease protein
VLTALLTGLLGLIVVAPFRSLSAYLLPSGLPLVVLALPLIDHVGWWPSPLFHLLPSHGALLLLRAGFVPIDPWQIGLGLVSQGIWLALLVAVARGAVERHIAARRGGP